MSDSTVAALADVYRDKAAQLTATLVRTLGDFGLAEELVHDAMVIAMQRWRVEGIPRRPGAWLLTVARRRGLDALRRDARYRAKLVLLDQPIQQEPDDRLRLIFTCCHPALAREAAGRAHPAHDLRLQRCGDCPRVRDIRSGHRPATGTGAAKIIEAGIPYRLPDATWDRTAIAAACGLLLEAGRLRRPGQYQIQAAIVACHAEAPTWQATDWPQILALYDVLVVVAPSPVARLNRPIALRYVHGPEAALAEVDRLGPKLSRYRLIDATRAELLRDLNCPRAARVVDEQALALTSNPAERALLEQRLA